MFVDSRSGIVCCARCNCLYSLSVSHWMHWCGLTLAGRGKPTSLCIHMLLELDVSCSQLMALDRISRLLCVGAACRDPHHFCSSAASQLGNMVGFCNAEWCMLALGALWYQRPSQRLLHPTLYCSDSRHDPYGVISLMPLPLT